MNFRADGAGGRSDGMAHPRVVTTPTASEFIERKRQECLGEHPKEYRFKDISRKGHRIWRLEARTLMPQSDYPEKVFMVERLRYVRDEGAPPPWGPEYDPCQYRIGYFIVAQVGRRRGNWWWGQYCPIIPSRDLYRLLRKAEKEGTILKENS